MFYCSLTDGSWGIEKDSVWCWRCCRTFLRMGEAYVYCVVACNEEYKTAKVARGLVISSSTNGYRRDDDDDETLFRMAPVMCSFVCRFPFICCFQTKLELGSITDKLMDQLDAAAKLTATVVLVAHK